MQRVVKVVAALSGLVLLPWVHRLYKREMAVSAAA